MKYCQNCGSSLEDDAKFCQNCGTPTAEAQPEPHSATHETQSAALDANQESAGSAPDVSKESTSSGAESVVQKNAVSKKSPLRWVLCCILIVVVIAVVFSQCAGTSKAQILETAKTFTLDSSDVTLGEAVETNLSDVEWTCYKQDDGYWTVTVSGYNANEDSTVSLLISVTEISDDQVYYEPIYGEVNGSGSSAAADINYAIAIVYDNVGQALCPASLQNGARSLGNLGQKILHQCGAVARLSERSIIFFPINRSHKNGLHKNLLCRPS